MSYGKRLKVRESSGSARVKTGSEVAKFMSPLLEREIVEVGYVLCFDTKHGVIGYHQLSRGSLDSTSMRPREVFQAALSVNAAGVVLVHNHPSGDPTPSPDDFALTVSVKNAGQVIGIELLDHVIVGHAGRYISVRELGRL